MVVWLGFGGVVGVWWCGWGLVVWLGFGGVVGVWWCGWGLVVWLGFNKGCPILILEFDEMEVLELEFQALTCDIF